MLSATLHLTERENNQPSIRRFNLASSLVLYFALVLVFIAVITTMYICIEETTEIRTKTLDGWLFCTVFAHLDICISGGTICLLPGL